MEENKMIKLDDKDLSKVTGGKEDEKKADTKVCTNCHAKVRAARNVTVCPYCGGKLN